MSNEEFNAVIHDLMSSTHVTDCETRDQKLKFVFERLDNDHSGALTMDEMMNLKKKLDPDADEATIRNSMAFLDKDESGTVTHPPLENLSHTWMLAPKR